jgi:hypothetical protein
MLRRPIARGGRPGVIGTMARTAVIAGTATAVSGGVARRQQAKAQEAADAEAYQEMQREQQYAAAAPPPPAPAAPAAGGAGDTIAQLKELATLKDQGILTDEEFAAQKARILGG